MRLGERRTVARYRRSRRRRRPTHAANARAHRRVLSLDPRVILTLLETRFVPVVASLAGDGEGNVYNVNADTVAETLAIALKAQKLIFLTGAPGVLRDRADPSSLIAFADPDDLTELLMRGQGSEMEMAIRSGGQNAGLERLMYFLQVGYFSRKISDRFDWSMIERDIERIMQMLEAIYALLRPEQKPIETVTVAAKK